MSWFATLRQHYLSRPLMRFVEQRLPPILRTEQDALEFSATRDRLTQGIYLTNDPNDRMGRIEDALHKVLAATDVEKQFRKLLKDGKLAAYTTEAALAEAKAKGLLDAFSVEKLLAARRATANAVRVDDFPAEYFRPHRQEEPPHHDQRERKTDRTSA